MKPSRYLLLALLALAACHSQPAPVGMKLGKPYMVAGKAYYPEYDPTYDKIGMASWYGPGFHGKYTASGEIYDQNDLTAAHPTLPMPSLVRVTNLSNGKSLIVRINDRGPFKSNRIIDLSKKAASELGIRNTSEVRVQFLKKETEEYMASLGGGGAQDMASVNADAARVRTDTAMHSTEPEEQLVESDTSISYAGQTITSAAPIMTVASGDLPTPQAEAAPAAKTPRENPFVKPVALSRNLTPQDDAGMQNPAPESAPFKRQVPPEPKAAAGGSLFIQAGSFASEENARKLSTRLDTIASMDIGKVEMGEKTWWRVRLGPFASKSDAASALDKVHQSGLPDARIVSQ